MECNKDEAIRAKEIAEKKMKSNDFEGARKIALKAKNLYPELENIAQLLSICDVHCSAQKRLLGSEKDWYGILQMEMLADEAMVKKQYRKLALILHPDKNRFCGAEGAFKLICEANAVLSDPTKKSLYDTKIKISQLKKQKGEKNVSNGLSSMNQNQASWSSPSVRKDVFWTCCPYCSIRYMYHRDCLNRSLRCQTCDKLFVGYEIGAQNVPSKPGPSAEKVVEKKGNFKFGVVNNKGPPTKQEGSASMVSGNFEAKETDKNNAKFSDRGKEGGTSNGDAANRDSREVNKSRKRDRKLAADISGHSDLEDVTVKGQANNLNSESSWDNFEGRSMLKRQNVSCSDKTDSANPVKSSQESKLLDGEGENGNLKNCNQNSTEADCDNLEEDVLHCPDPEFNDFDKVRDDSHFDVNQFWACYDTLDGMPRFYAKIKKVRASPFELSFTWLEADPINEAYEEWVDEELPVGCGSFRLGKTEKTQSKLTFSHQVHCEKGKKRGSLVIYPRGGEIWAVFKDWDISWSHKDNFKYEIVEVLSDFVVDEGIKVCYLDKVKGFLSLFQRNDKNWFQIGANEIYKFSHFVPCVKMSGFEREGVPLGCFELDPAALPMNPDDLYYPSKTTKVDSVESAKKKSDTVILDGTNTPNKAADLEGDMSKLRRSPRVFNVVKQNAN